VVQIPDSVRQQLAPVLKHHFWILAAVVPLLLIPAVFFAAADRQAVIDRDQMTIDGQISALEAVRNTADHPNAAWAEAFDRQTAAVREELLGEWKAFWESQRPLRVWPEVLGPDFMASIAAVESGDRDELMFRDQQRYQNTVGEIVRQLPGRMGCKELMVSDGGPGPGARRRPRGGLGDNAEATELREVLVWRAEDQKRLLESFRWNSPPSTTGVRLAQEELWVYGLLCDAIRRVNEGATGLFDSRITTVDELAVGYPAAEDRPGGQGAGRVMLRAQPEPPPNPYEFQDGLPMSEPGLESPERELEPRPLHPRFSGGADDSLRPGGIESRSGRGRRAEVVLAPDDMLRQWIYVDFNGRPLSAPELATAADARLVHLMPFVLRVVMDQRKIDRLLAELAAGPVPIDVRQVRVNPAAAGAGGGRGPRVLLGGGPPAADSGPGERRRPFDVTLELRGTVGLATRPDPAVIGGVAATDGTGGGG
jgi:hypothetical protein